MTRLKTISIAILILAMICAAPLLIKAISYVLLQCMLHPIHVLSVCIATLILLWPSKEQS